MFSKLWVRATNKISDFGYDLHLLGEDEKGNRIVVTNIEVSRIIDNIAPAAAPPLGIDEVAAQQLMNDLWLLGIRPKKELYGNPDKEDIKNHLEDMRRLVFSGLTVKIDTSTK